MKKTRYSGNKYLERIRLRTNEGNTFRAVSRFVAEFRDVQESLADLAAKLGVVQIVEQKLPFEGGIFASSAGPVIKLNSLSAQTRKRFTLAHELAHLIVSPNTANSARRCLKSSDLETACDFVAAELLMSEEAMRNSIERRASIESLLSLTSQFGVSLQAAAVRVKDLGLWNESIGMWRWDQTAKELWWVGRRYWIDYQPPFVAFERAAQTHSVVTTSEFYSDFRGTHATSLQVKKLGHNYLVGLVTG